MSIAALVAWAPALPVVAALAVAASGERRANLREALSLAAGVALCLLLVILAPAVLAGERPVVVLAEPVPGLPLALSPEPLGLLFALVAGFLWPVTTLYAIGYMRGHGEVNQTRFYAAFALALSAAMGIAFAANMLTLFFFYELLTLATYPLVTHAGDAARAARAGVYLGVLLGTSIGFLLLAMVWTWWLAGTLDFTPGGILEGQAEPAILGLLLVLYVLGTGKAAVMPFHRWLPAAMVAPTPVSALLHAVAVVKAGVFTILKVVVYLFGIDLVADLAAADWLAYLAGAGILIASLVAMSEDNLKRRLAYSTVSQLGYVVMGALLGAVSGVVGGAMHIAMHAFGKITLFFCAGAILVAAHKTRVSELGGLGRRMPVTMLAFFVGALAIAGLPPTGGTWSKWVLMTATMDTGQWVLMGILMLSSLLSIGYLVAIPVRAFFTAPVDSDAGAGIREAPASCLLAILVTAGGCIVLFVAADSLFQLARLILPASGVET